MVSNEIMHKLFIAFPKGNINRNMEFVADPNPKVNSYLYVGGNESELEVTARVLESLSREAYKSQHYVSEKSNDRVHKYHLDGINKFCGTEFTEEDIEEIYTYLGGRINHKKTLDFVRSGYDFRVLTAEERGG